MPELKPKDIRVYEPESEDKVYVEVHYTRQIRLLGLTIERKLVAESSIRRREI